MPVAHLTGGQGVTGSNPAVPTEMGRRAPFSIVLGVVHAYLAQTRVDQGSYHRPADAVGPACMSGAAATYRPPAHHLESVRE